MIPGSRFVRGFGGKSGTGRSPPRLVTSIEEECVPGHLDVEHRALSRDCQRWRPCVSCVETRENSIAGLRGAPRQ